MKHRVFLIAALIVCVLGGLDASAENTAYANESGNAQPDGRPVLETIPSTADKNEYVARHKEEWGMIYERLSKAYQSYERKARIAQPNLILVGVPQSLVNGADLRNGAKKTFGKTSLRIVPCRSSNDALMHTLYSTFAESLNSTLPTTWDKIKAVDTPFDFSSNYSSGSFLTAAFYNTEVYIHSEGKPVSATDLKPAFDFATGLFNDYKTVKDGKKVDYLDLKPEAVKLAADQTGTVFKIDCPYREAYRNLKNEFYVLAVSDKGELSVEKAYYHFGGRDSVPENFPLRLLERDTVEGKTFFYHVADSGEATAYPALADIPDTVFLKLPEGETSAEVTFYFISKDGEQYAAQKVELNVPEGTEPRTISSKPTVYDIQGEIYGTGRKPLDKVKMDVEFLDESDPERGATEREEMTFDSAFRLVTFGYPETQLKLTFSRDGYVSSSHLFTPEVLRAEQESNRIRSIEEILSPMRDRYMDASDREIVLKKKINHTMVNLPADMIHISGELKYDPANNTRIVCDLSEVEQGKVQLKTVDLKTPPGSRYLEIELFYNSRWNIELNYPLGIPLDRTIDLPPDCFPIVTPSSVRIHYRTPDENDRFQPIRNLGVPGETKYTFDNYLDRDKVAPEDWYLDGARERQRSYWEETLKIILDEKPYVREMVDRICYETGKDLDLPPKESDGNGTAVAFAFLKCGKHCGKIGIRHVCVQFNPDDPKKSTATLEFELHINKAENDRNLTVR